MPKRYKLLIFDWDGTLMDSAAAISKSLQTACADLNLPVPTDEAARYVIGLGMSDALKHIQPQLPPSCYPQFLERYRDHFWRADADTTLFKGVVESVDVLHKAGFLLAVATGKSRRGLDRALESTGLQRYFHATRCADEGFSKPDPGMLHQLLEATGATADQALMIGDTTHDMEMARSAGMSRLAAAYGAHPRETLLAYEPVVCADVFSDIHNWLTRNA
jgi:phosphoglycolate phosphatase